MQTDDAPGAAAAAAPAAAPPADASFTDDLAAHFALADTPPGTLLTTISLDDQAADARGAAAAPAAGPAALTAAAAAAGSGSSVSGTPATSRPGSAAGAAAPVAAAAHATTVLPTSSLQTGAQDDDAALQMEPAHAVKVVVKDAAGAAAAGAPDGKHLLGLPFGSSHACVVRVECSSSSCPLVVPAAAAAGDGQGPVVVEVRRHDQDFETLSRLIKTHSRGHFIPRLPPADWLGGTDRATRLVDLQDYISTVANHPVLQAGSQELRLFLSAPGDLGVCAAWQAMLQRPVPFGALLGGMRGDAASTAAAGGSSQDAAGGSSSGGSGPGMMLRMKAAATRGLMAVVQPKAAPAQAELPADEQELQAAKQQLKEMLHHVSGCVHVVRSLVASQDAVSEGLGALGRALSHFARQQESLAAQQGQYTPAGSSAMQRGTSLQRVGYAALREQSLAKQSVRAAGASVVFLPDLQTYLPECIAALTEREEALAAVQLLAGELRDRQAAAARAAGGGGGDDKRLAGIQALEKRKAAAEAEYSMLKQRNKADLARFNTATADSFARHLGRFVATQAKAAAAAAEVWAGVAEQFGGSDLGAGSS